MASLVSFGFAGKGEWEWHLMTRSLLVQRILLSIRREAKTPHEISAEINADEPYVKDELDWLSHCTLVKKFDENRFIANIIVLSREEKKPLVDLAKRLCKEEVKVISGELPKMKAAFETCSFKHQGYSWHQMSYIILAALLADMGLYTSFRRHGLIPQFPERIDGGAWYIWGLEGGHASKRHFGVEFDSDKSGGSGHLQSKLVKQPTKKPLNSNGKAIMLALSSKPLSLEEIAETTGLAIEAVKKTLEKLSSHGYFIEREGKYNVNFPIFYQDDLEIMIGEVRRVSDLIVERVLRPNEINFRRLYKEIGLAKLEREYGAYLCMLYHLIMPHTLDQLVESGLLPELPAEADATWGFWGWVGELKL